MSLTAYLEAVLFSLGALLMLLAAIGIARFPDLLMRSQAATKAASLGAGLMLAGVAVHFHSLATTARVVAIVLFLFATTPVAAHLTARAAYHAGVPVWEATRVDELREALDRGSRGPGAEPDDEGP